MTLKIKTSDEMIALGKKIGELLEPNMVITLTGDLGAGKTTMTKGIALGLDIKNVINSPTFTIMKIHQGRLTLYHMDVYRINNDSGDEYLEEYFESGGVCVVEWAENISDFLPEKCLKITINYTDEGREVEIVGQDEYLDLIRRLEVWVELWF